jgi:crotonobetainyl-CoA:carnitine CoA-transferase CaiB-like acyl-CoA transferase
MKEGRVAGPMHGIKVVELGIWVAAPAAAAILADWGADVIKVEAPSGDPLRAASAAVLPPDATHNPHFDADNRGKRSVVLDLRTDAGRDHLFALLDSADVFLTNVRTAGLARLGLDPESVCTRNPRLIYAAVTGYGLTGPMADVGGFDLGVFWAYSGVADLLTAPGSPPPIQRSAMGDHQTALAAAAMISAALLHRERTGAGQLVSTSLLRTAAYHIGADLNAKLMIDQEPDRPDRQTAWNPVWNNYATADGRRIWLINPASDVAWPAFARLVGHPEWLDDPRFATQQSRSQHGAELVARFDEAFARHTFAEWVALLNSEPKVLWAPVNTVDDLLADPQTEAAGVLVDVDEAGGATREVAAPVDFHGAPCGPPHRAPALGEHTEEIVAELASESARWPARQLVDS